MMRRHLIGVTRLPANRHNYLFARLEAIVDVLAVEVWSFSS